MIKIFSIFDKKLWKKNQREKSSNSDRLSKIWLKKIYNKKKKKSNSNKKIIKKNQREKFCNSNTQVTFGFVMVHNTDYEFYSFVSFSN